MSIEKNETSIAAKPESTEHLMTGIFTPGDRQAMTVGDLSHTELLAQNDIIVKQINDQVQRLAQATITSVAALPEAWQQSFYQGISCYSGKPDELVYAAIFKQHDLKTQSA
jgi:hypothetical protein